MKRGEDMAQKYKVIQTMADMNFLSIIIFAFLYIFVIYLAYMLIRRLSAKNKRGASFYALIPALVLTFFPIRAKLLPHVICTGVFDRILWERPQKPQFLELGLVQSYFSHTDPHKICITLSQALFAVWLTGVAISLIAEIWRFIKLKKSIKRYSVKCSNGSFISLLREECHLKKCPELRIYDKCPTPFAMGLFHPMILLPTESYSPDESRLILRHEFEHIRRRDILTKGVFVFFRSLNWFNPVMYFLCSRSFEDMEISVDEKVSKGLDNNGKRTYSELIVKTAAKSRVTDISTYLSLDGERLKSRISSIVTDKKGSLIPTVLLFCAVFLISLLIMPSPTFFGMNIVSTEPLFLYLSDMPIEYDPVIANEELRTVKAESYEEAAAKYLDLCLMNYSRETMPDYYRIDDYSVISSRCAPSAAGGILNSIDSRLVDVGYYIEPSNKCGNTVHDVMYAPFVNINGLYYNSRSYEVRKTGYDEKSGKNIYHIENIGVTTGSQGWFYNYHFSDNIGEMEWYCGIMAEAGVYDHDEADPEEVREKMMNIHKQGELWQDMEHKPNGKFEYCGYDFDHESRTVCIYGNVYSGKPHGVKLICQHTDDPQLRDSPINPTYRNSNISHVTIKCVSLYPSIEYTDTFDKIDFADIPVEATSENARARLEYMMTPCDGTDFTVLAYTNITESDGAVYADVRFKGRLEGVYSESRYIDEHGGENEWYMPDVRII